MTVHRVLIVCVVSLAMLLVGVLGVTGYLAWQNYLWKTEVRHYAGSTGRLEAMALFNKGYRWLYRLDGKCDETHSTGQHEGPFEVFIVFYQPILGEAHRCGRETYVAEFNEQMRWMLEHPAKFGKAPPADKGEVPR
jgi:hypothetical protein